ncbi:MAG TPA: ABC transporter substrate-binding protein [Nocardioidaceae bacterium]|nr:ABC transporter substrate-binding protein [Nocardioidaceae bacterium]
MTFASLSKKTRASRALAIAMATPLLLLAACGNGGNDALKSGSDSGNGGGGGEVVIAYQDYTEMSIMAEMYAALLKEAGYEPTLKGVGDRAIYAGELTNGKVDVAPEYASSMTEYLNREANGANAKPVATPDLDQTMAKLEELAKPKNMTPLEPAKAEDANAFAVTQDFSDSKGVKTLSDLGKLGGPVALAAAPDCPDRQDCQKGLEAVYGVKVSKFEPLGFGTPQTKDALTKGEVQVGQVGTSDGQIQQLKLVVLQDDKNWQNAENLVPVVSTKFLDAHPDAEKTLNALSEVLTTEDLMKLNAQVDAERQLPADVAKQYLTDKGLV